MTDDKRLGRLRVMVGHLQRTLETDAPDLKIVEKLLTDALDLAIELSDPPDPYANQNLRPGLTPLIEPAAPKTPLVRPHPPQGVPDV